MASSEHPVFDACRQLLALAILTFASNIVLAAEGTLSVQVVDRVEQPVADAAVFLLPQTSLPQRPISDPPVAVMDQVDLEYVPHILVVQTNTEVGFPNSDDVNHHVYSFSNPNQFELPLYKGKLHPPVRFEHAGLVIVGCNIHDHMLGYILVVDTPYFGKTDDDGGVFIPGVLPGTYDVVLWSSRFRAVSKTVRQVVSVSDETSVQDIAFKLSDKLRHPRDTRSSSLQWTDY